MTRLLYYFMPLLLQLAFPTFAQMTKAEQNVRMAGNQARFLQNICRVPYATGCLCQRNEYVVTTFRVVGGKSVSICASNLLNRSQGYLVYRFGRPGQVELEFPQDWQNSLSKFTINESIGSHVAGFEDYVWFENGNYTYILWGKPGTKAFAFGLDIINNNNGQLTTFKGIGSRTGEPSQLIDILWEKKGPYLD